MTRQDTIVSMIEATGFETVSSLAEALDVNVSTIRRDLEHLAEAGLVRRTHGGAIPIPQDEDTEEFLQDSPNRAEKRAIGPAMAERILDGQSVFIDSGSTCLEVARALDARRVTVVTHDLLEAAALAARVAVLDEGRLVACDTPHALERSTDPIVRGLLDTRPGGHA